MEFLRLAGIDQLADQEAASLPLGSRRLVEVARALCAQPGVVLLDEPASGSTTRRFCICRPDWRHGRSGSHCDRHRAQFPLITSVAGVVHVLHLAASSPVDRRRKSLATKTSLRATSERPPRRAGPVERGLGRPSHEPATRDGARAPARLEGMSPGTETSSAPRGLDVHPAGSIEVVLGRNGVGKTTLLSTLAGLLPLSKGSLKLQARTVDRSPPTAERRRGSRWSKRASASSVSEASGRTSCSAPTA